MGARLVQTHHFRLEGRLDLPALQLLPVDSSEEGMFSNIPLTLRPTAQPLARVLGHQLESRGEDVTSWSGQNG